MVTRSSTKIWLIGSPKSVLISSCLPTNGDVFRHFFYFSKSHNLKKVEAAKQGTKVVSDILDKIWYSNKEQLAALQTTPWNA